MRKVLAAVTDALGGEPQFEHGMVAYRTGHAPANALSSDVLASISDWLLERTRSDPEKKQLKAIDSKMSSNVGMYRGFIQQPEHANVSDSCFRAHRRKKLTELGFKATIVRHRCVTVRDRQRACGWIEQLVCGGSTACARLGRMFSPVLVCTTRTARITMCAASARRRSRLSPRASSTPLI